MSICNKKWVKLFVIAVVVSFVIATVQCDSENKDLIISAEEKQLLNKFKERMSPVLLHDYMKEEIYLIRWLRARNFKIEAAEKMLLMNLKWREQQRMDTIWDEDWSDFEERYKYWHDSVDKKGQPFGYMNIGLWNIRRAVISGEIEKLSRYLDATFEKMCAKPRNIVPKNENVTQVSMIVDISGFSLTQQGCLPCIPIYIKFILDYETYYPGCVDKIMLINTPTAFEIVLNAMRPFMSKQTRSALQVYGTNKDVWQPILFRYIDKSELPSEVGGNGSDKYNED